MFTNFVFVMELVIEAHIPPPETTKKEETINKIYSMNINESCWIDSLFIKSSDLLIGLSRMNKKSGTDHLFTTKKEYRNNLNGFRIWRIS
jgi:hypothetical protein